MIAKQSVKVPTSPISPHLATKAACPVTSSQAEEGWGQDEREKHHIQTDFTTVRYHSCLTLLVIVVSLLLCLIYKPSSIIYRYVKGNLEYTVFAIICGFRYPEVYWSTPPVDGGATEMTNRDWTCDKHM
jgi:hypothetical protein